MNLRILKIDLTILVSNYIGQKNCAIGSQQTQSSSKVSNPLYDFSILRKITHKTPIKNVLLLRSSHSFDGQLDKNQNDFPKVTVKTSNVVEKHETHTQQDDPQVRNS